MIPTLQEALDERGYDTLTPVQEAVSDPDLATRDLLVSAQTGSGKTVGFGLAIGPTLLDDSGKFGRPEAPMALVVAPTRELAFQVKRELEWLYAKAGARVASCVGGMDVRDERRWLERGAHIVVGTPGRLCDHIRRGSLDMTALRAVVLDEADEMLDLGFREDLEFMLGEAPEDRRTLLFSATVPPAIAALAETFQRDAQRISTISQKEQHADISYQALAVAPSDTEHAIFNLLRFHDADAAIVFANTRAQVNHLTARLSNRGVAVVTLSGELSQSERTHALQAMRDGRAKVCVATDVAARGIDLPNLTLVIHADLPTNTESLLHRSGRTGRAGRKGISALIVPPKAMSKAKRLLKWAKITAEWAKPPSAEDVLRKDEERLLNDPLWDDEITQEQAAFAATLLETRTPEAVAAAYLRLYRSRHGAPEDLQPADAPPERKERKPFGPSTWFTISAGRNDRAEARWLLPLLCRAGNIDKTSIGAIRVQDSETFVELANPAVAGFLDNIGMDGELEDGLTATKLDTPPNLPAERPRGGKPGGGRSFRDRDDRGPHRGKPHRGPKPSKSWHDDLPEDGPRAPRKPSGAKPGKPSYRDDKPRSDKSWSDKPKSDKAWSDKPKSDKPKYGEKPQYGDKPKGKYGAPKGKPTGGYKGKPTGGKPGGKPDGKPGSKPKTYAGAADSSKRFTPPGQAKSGGKPHRGGGEAPPRRK